jgi:MFS family permease
MATAGAGLAFAINAVTYVAPVVAMIVLGRMGLSGRESLSARSAARAAGGSAATFVRRNTWAAGLLVGVIVTSTAMEIQRTLAPAMASETLGIAEGNAGFLLAAQSVGSAISFLLFVPIRRRGWSRKSALIGLGLQAVGVVAAALAPGIPVALTGFFLIGLGFAMCFPVLTASLQEATPDELRGRVMSYHQLALLGHRPVTALIIGTVATAVSLVAGALIWLVLLPVGLIAIRIAWRDLPAAPLGKRPDSVALAESELVAGSVADS